jgi:glycine/D-amino acid oxidase-like deaminating enzyme
MKTYDWMVVGGGITGAAVGYELIKKGFSVLLLEQDKIPQNATRFSYGGIAYWAGAIALTRQLCAEGIARHRILSQELEADTQFRELDLLLTIDADHDPEIVAAPYQACAIPPQLLSVEAACALEPLLNRDAIAGALTVRHGHVSPEAIIQAYRQAFCRLGGTWEIGQVVQIRTPTSGIVTATGETYYSSNLLICAGGFSRALLKTVGIQVRLYFTHAELIETPPVDVQLRSLVMPAEATRLPLESQSSTAAVDHLWDEPGHEPVAPILETGAIQFLNDSLRIGQISRVLTDLNAKVDPIQSETEMRLQVKKVLPALADLPGTWHHCLAAFTADQLPLIGVCPEVEGIHLFSGFSSPFVLVPPLAERFARWVAGEADEIIPQLSPLRFANPRSS